MRSDLIDITVMLHHETEKAWLVSDTGERKDAVWIAKSQAELEPSGGSSMHTLTLPEHIATEKGLI